MPLAEPHADPLPESDADAARAFAAVLSADDHVLWAGRPDARRFTRTDHRLVALGAFWTAVAGAGFWGFTGALLADHWEGVSFALRVAILLVCAAPFVAVAAFCLGGHVLLWRRVRLRTAYAVTRRRVLVRRPALRYLGPDVLRELPRDAVGEVVVEGLRHGTGSLDVHHRGAGGADEPLRLDDVRGAEALATLLRAGRGRC